METLSEDRLYARRKRHHEEAMGTHNEAAKTEDLFNQKVDEASMKWTDGIHHPSTDSKAYVKLVTPSGKLTKEVAKDLLQRLKIPVKTEMGVLMQHMYKHYFYGSETTVPKIDKKEAASKAIFTTLRESGYAVTKANSDGSLIASVKTTHERPHYVRHVSHSDSQPCSGRSVQASIGLHIAYPQNQVGEGR